jgi:hypothetical protein
MGPLHCPLCIGLGVMSIARCLAWFRLLWILRPELLQQFSAPRRGLALQLGAAQ